MYCVSFRIGAFAIAPTAQQFDSERYPRRKDEPNNFSAVPTSGVTETLHHKEPLSYNGGGGCRWKEVPTQPAP